MEPQTPPALVTHAKGGVCTKRGVLEAAWEKKRAQCSRCCRYHVRPSPQLAYVAIWTAGMWGLSSFFGAFSGYRGGSAPRLGTDRSSESCEPCTLLLRERHEVAEGVLLLLPLCLLFWLPIGLALTVEYSTSTRSSSQTAERLRAESCARASALEFALLRFTRSPTRRPSTWPWPTRPIVLYVSPTAFGRPSSHVFVRRKRERARERARE